MITANRKNSCLLLSTLLASLTICNCVNAQPIGSAVDRDAQATDVVNGKGLRLSDAVERSLQMQPSIQLQKEYVDQAKGALRSASGDFDWRLENTFSYSEDLAPTSASYTLKSSDTFTAGMKLGKQFRSGVYVEPNIQYNQNTAAQKEEYLAGGSETPAQNSARLNFLLRVPLLQGLGENATAFREIAAARELEAARFDLLHKTSQSVLDTVLAYLDYLGAHQRSEVYTESVHRAKSILEKTEVLAKADELPTAEILNVSANLADKQSMKISAQQSVLEARNRLGQVIGIPYDQTEALSAPADGFPRMDDPGMVRDIADKSALRTAALNNRMDLLALRKRLEGTETTLVAARNQMRPLLNLELNLGYDGYKSGSQFKQSMQSLEDRQSAPDWSAGVSFVYPLGNNTSRGNLEQALSRTSQGRIQISELERTIQSNITLLINTLFSACAELAKASEAVNTYQVAVNNEKAKYLMGEATLLDLLYIQDRLDSALLNRISVLQRSAVSSARLRFEVGTLVSYQNGAGHVDVTDLIQTGNPGQ